MKKRRSEVVVKFPGNPRPVIRRGAADVLIMPVIRIDRHEPPPEADVLAQLAVRAFESCRIPADRLSAGPRIDGGWCSWCGADTFRARHRPTCGPPPRLLPTPPSDRYGGEEPNPPTDDAK
jgi:hypothetical protein